MVFNRKPELAAQPVSQFGGPPPGAFAGGPSAFAGTTVMQAAMPEAIVESVIGNDLSIEGETITIRCKGSLKILGNIQADLHSKRLEVGKEASISGAIAADTIDVFGRVQGSILGAKVILHAGSEVEGDIMSQLLSVEEGANFDGRSRRVTNAADIAPQLERPDAPSAARADAPVRSHVIAQMASAMPQPASMRPMQAATHSATPLN